MVRKKTMWFNFAQRSGRCARSSRAYEFAEPNGPRSASRFENHHHPTILSVW